MSPWGKERQPRGEKPIAGFSPWLFRSPAPYSPLQLCPIAQRAAYSVSHADGTGALEGWRWTSPWIRLHGNAKQKSILSPWPADRPHDWTERVNQPLDDGHVRGQNERAPCSPARQPAMDRQDRVPSGLGTHAARRRTAKEDRGKEKLAASPFHVLTKVAMETPTASLQAAKSLGGKSKWKL